MVRHCRPFFFTVLVALALTAPARIPLRAATPCNGLASLQLRNGTITLAEEVAQGAFTPAGVGFIAPAAARTYDAAPAFCRVTATLTPTSDSEIKIEVWLPRSGWNGKLQAVGNGGWAGTISHTGLANAVRAGYAAAATDTGHSTPGASFVTGHPEKLVDYAHRSLHELAVQAKVIVGAHYGAAPKTSLWNGCSTGGNQGLTIASKYPEDFDAIIAGAAPDPRARLMSVRLLINRLVHRSPDSYIPPDKYPAIHRAAIEACDVRDGARDEVIENPRACEFDVKALECKGPDAPNCLTAAQVETATLLYADVKHPKTGQTLYPPLLVPGSELVWGTLAGPQPFPNAVDTYRYLAHNNPEWDPRTFDAATDIELMDRAAAPLNTVTPDLRPFFKRGGKLLTYHGWNDRQVPAMSSVTFFERVLRAVGPEAARTSIQLYMVPGMDHCQGGVGTDVFDKVAAIEDWMSTGLAPAHIAASRIIEGKVARTRPLCPYPQVARYNGTGSLDEAAGFSCVAPAMAQPAVRAEAAPDWPSIERETMAHFQALLRFDTSDPPGNESAAAEYLKQVLDREGIATKIFELEANRPNLVARLKGNGTKRPLLLMGHTDVVNVDPAKWTFPPFSATRDGGHVSGRGTLDDKDNVTAALMTMILLRRMSVPLDRDVIFLAEAGEEGTTRVGIQFMVERHFSEIDAEYCLAEGGSVPRSGGRVRYASVQTAEKIPHGIQLTATGTAGHGSVPLESNAILRLTQAVTAAATWKPPIQLNDTTREYFTRMAAISPAADAARYRAVIGNDAQAAQAAVDYFAKNDPRLASMVRASISPNIIQAGYRINVIPSEAKATLDVRLLSNQDPEAFLNEVRKVVNDQAIRVEWIKRDVRPGTPSARLDSEVFKVLESGFARHYDATVLPTMSTGATDMAYLREKGVQCYGVGPAVDVEDGPKGFGAHSDQERILESELHKFVRFHYDVVRDLARAQQKQ